MNEPIYERLGVPTVVNAAGTKTRISGSLMRPEAVEAMAEASRSFVRVSDLQARASERIAEVTGAEAGYVTCGAAAGLALGVAACIAGDDLETMSRLPDTRGVADEIVVPRTHRTGYDRAFRAAGASIVDVGTNDPHLGTGSRSVEPWELEAAIGDSTAAVGYVQKEYTEPPLPAVAEVAHDHDVPVIVDAAAEVPPVSNLSRFVDEGADLVAFSGGKGIRGPQTTGILAGRRDLVESVALQHLDTHAADAVWDPPSDLVDVDRYDGVPRQGIGRPMKVGKEEIAGLLRALELFVEEDHDARREEWHTRAERIADALSAAPALSTRTTAGGETSVAPEVRVEVDEEAAGRSTADLVLSLRREDPRVFVGADALDDRVFTVSPMCLDDEETNYVVERIRAAL